jgi:hypothetical protein
MSETDKIKTLAQECLDGKWNPNSSVSIIGSCPFCIDARNKTEEGDNEICKNCITPPIACSAADSWYKTLLAKFGLNAILKDLVNEPEAIQIYELLQHAAQTGEWLDDV